MAVNSYQDLHVWQVGMDLAEDCYRVTQRFPREELFGLTSQIRRAAGSVPANVAEGQGRYSTKDFVRCLGIARGSLKELETHLILASWVGHLSADDLARLLQLSDRVSRMITRLRQSLLPKIRRLDPDSGPPPK